VRSASFWWPPGRKPEGFEADVVSERITTKLGSSYLLLRRKLPVFIITCPVDNAALKGGGKAADATGQRLKAGQQLPRGLEVSFVQWGFRLLNGHSGLVCHE
jgi:hypothetical protein